MRLGILLIMLTILPAAFGQDLDPDEILKSAYLSSSLQRDDEMPSMSIVLENQQMHKLANLSLEVVLEDEANQFKLLRYIRDSEFELQGIQGKYDLIIKADDIRKQKTYYYKGSLDTREGETHIAVMQPCASVSGSVYDRNGDLVADSQVKFECINSYGETDPVYTDSSGSFLKKYLPIGDCTLYAVRGELVGSKKAVLAHGHHDIHLNLTRKSSDTLGSNFAYIIIPAFLVLLISFIIIKRRRPVASPNNDNAQNPTQIANSHSRLEDVQATLSKQENQIIDFIKQHGECYQNKLVYGIGIPKTSISRLLSGLELKKIIQVEWYGKVKKVKLTDWILEK